MGHFLADRKYGGRNIVTIEQQFRYLNNQIQDIFGNPVAATTLNAHLNLLEDFSPRRTVEDPFFWIPQGLFYDLIDNRNDRDALPRRVDLNDAVFSYTNQQFFNALDADINNLPAYRVRLLSENANRDAAGVTTIFQFYGY